MVQVARGCQRCFDAHARCDGKPPCSRCRHLGLSCPGPDRIVKHHNESRPLQLRCRSGHSYSLSPSPSPSSSSLSSSDSHSKALIPQGTGRPSPQHELNPLTIDESLSPSLSVRVISSQQTRIFTDFILSSFPCYFKCTEKRVSVNWVAYVDTRRGSKNSCFDWAVRACTTTYTGFLQNDRRYMEGAREFYIRSLRGLAGLLSDVNTAKSDEALATAICLSVFEKHNCTTPSSWLRHAKGIETLMRLRGPGAHIHGFGRSMYIVYRNFLVTAAMISGEACFLEEPEWQALNEQIVSDNAKQPDSLAYTEVAERGFREVTKIPGYVKRVRDLLVLPQKKQSKLRKPLLLSILGTRAALRGIHTEFGVSISMVRAGHGHKEDFIGPLPQYFFDGFSRHSIRGIRSGMLILNYLVILLDPKQRTEIEAENEILSDGIRSDSLPSTPEPTAPLSPPSTPGKPKLLIQSLIGPDTKQPPTTDWMDRIVTTMGMDGVRVSLLD